MRRRCLSAVAKKNSTFQITNLIIVITQLQINSVVTPTEEGYFVFT